MIQIVHGNDTNEHAALLSSMFDHRRLQFCERLGWEVTIDDAGRERDEYDDLNPLYLICQDETGQHEASMRFLPTTGDTMINDHFTEMTGGVVLRSPLIWECTRLCLSPTASPQASKKLMLATIELGLLNHLKFFVGIFDERMVRVYRRIGWSPTIVGSGTCDDKPLLAGLWPIDEVVRECLLARLHDSPDQGYIGELAGLSDNAPSVQQAA